MTRNAGTLETSCYVAAVRQGCMAIVCAIRTLINIYTTHNNS